MTHCMINKDTRIVTAINLTRDEAISKAPSELMLLQEDYEVVPQIGHMLSDDNTNMVEPSQEDLRRIRNTLLQDTDWRATIDYPGDDQESWLKYRQELRDLPSEFKLGTWPTRSES